MSSQMEMPREAAVDNIPSQCPFCAGATATDEARDYWWCDDSDCGFHHINPNEDVDPWQKKGKHPWQAK